jgi:uncharacterized repeat protein (TIGR02543 family)
MKRIILVTMVFLFFISSVNLSAQWVKIYEGSDNEVAYSIQQTSDSGYIVAGETMSFGVGGYDVWVLKLDSIGDIEWQRTYGGSDYDGAKSIQETSDGGYIVAGYTYSFGAGEADFWILKLSIIGDIEWQRSYGTTLSEGASSVQQTSDGGYIVAGGTYNISGRTGFDFWVLKLASNGDIEWQRIYETESALLYPPSIRQANDGGYIVGASNSLPGLDRDFWALKLTSTGDIAWQYLYQTYGMGREVATDIQLTNDGGYIVAGYALDPDQGSMFKVLKLTPTGQSEWGYSYGGYVVDPDSGVHGCDNVPRSIQQTNDGGYIVVGYTWNWLARANRIWVLKLAPTGIIEWEKIFGSSEKRSDAWAIEQTSDGGYIIAGERGISHSSGDILLLNLSPDGDIDSSCEFKSPQSCRRVVEHLESPGRPTYITPQDTNIVPLDTIITPQDTNATVSQCGVEYSFTISSSIGGSTEPPVGTYTHSPFYSGAEVQIEALPGTGYRFSGWTGDVPSGCENDNPITIIIDSDKTIIANFIAQYTLIIVAGTRGTTDPLPGSYIYDSGIAVSITATPSSGYQFSGWSGAASGTTNPITITMDSDKSITANFSAIPPEEEAGKKGRCFIATAAYDSPLHPYVRILRDFRDKYFISNKIGRKLVGLYYKHSPFVANLITKHKALKVAIRISLLPMIIFSYLMVHFGPIITGAMFILVYVFPIFLILFFRRRMRRMEAKDLKTLASQN